MARVATGVLLLAGLWGAIVVFAWMFQERLIYLPDTSAPNSPADVRVEQVEFETGDGLLLSAWLLSHQDPVAWIVVANGNAGNRSHRLPMAQQLHARGYAVMLTDYRGYGGNPGRPRADAVRADFVAAIHWLDQALAPDHVVLLGESLGSAVAAAAAVERPPDALVLRSPFPTIADVARRHYPFLPTQRLLRDRHDTLTYLEGVGAPVLVIAGGRDRIVPPDLSRRVADAAAAEWVEVGGADHNDAALFVGETFIDAIDTFIRSQVATEPGYE